MWFLYLYNPNFHRNGSPGTPLAFWNCSNFHRNRFIRFILKKIPFPSNCHISSEGNASWLVYDISSHCAMFDDKTSMIPVIFTCRKKIGIPPKGRRTKWKKKKKSSWFGLLNRYPILAGNEIIVNLKVLFFFLFFFLFSPPRNRNLIRIRRVKFQSSSSFRSTSPPPPTPASP